MDRFTISLDEDLAAEFDKLIKERGYATRSEAVRDLLRDHLQRRHEHGHSKGFCVASLSYVYNHHERELAQRLATIQHAHHGLVVSTMHVHLDHEQCLESVMLKGPVKAVRELAEEIIAEKGVRHGEVNVVSVAPSSMHTHDGKAHRHLTPRL